MVNDTGFYTVEVDTSNGTQRAIGWLEIISELAWHPISPNNNNKKRKLVLSTLIGRFLGGHAIQCLRCLKMTPAATKVALWLFLQR